MAIISQTITRTIVGINPIGNNIWQIEFDPNQTIITSQNFTYPVIYGSSSALPVILNPFLNNIGNWDTNDYNATINNASTDRENLYYQQVDYDTNQTIPVNFDQIIAGTATRASIPNSNFTSYQFSGLRYWGSKNTTDDFNTASVSQSNVVQEIQNSNIGSTTLGYPSVNNWDASILEFNWGGGTYPEIYGGGALSLNQLLNVGSDKDKITKFSSTEDGFMGSIELEFPLNSLPILNQYTTNATSTNGARVSDYGFSVPPISTYMLPSAGVHTATINAGRAYVALNNQVYNVGTNSSGYYTTGSGATSNTEASLIISQSLQNGDRWFITLYDNLPNPVQGVLDPIASGSIVDYTTQTNGAYNYPLTKNGVYEITSVNTTNSYLYLNPYLPQGSSLGQIGGSASNLGMLIWKAVQGGYLLFNDATLSGVGKGGLLTSNPNPTIQQDFTYITQTYGNNPKNQ